MQQVTVILGTMREPKIAADMAFVAFVPFLLLITTNVRLVMNFR